MPRVKGSKTARARRNRLSKLVKGYWGRRKNSRGAQETLKRAFNFAFRDRKAKKRDFRMLWIARINAAARINGLSYSNMISGLKAAQVEINRKVLADLAANDPGAFAQLAQTAKASKPVAAAKA
jgi:large subunit ribosomal protein L20